MTFVIERTMTKTLSTYLVLLGLCFCFNEWRPSPRRRSVRQAATAEQKQPVEDPLGRSTPHGTVVGLITAVEQENLDRAAEYLESGLKPPDRRELAQKLWCRSGPQALHEPGSPQ